MSDHTELHGKILSFLSAEFTRKEGRQCLSVDLIYAPGDGFRDEPLRKWEREDQPELFDKAFDTESTEKLAAQIVEIALSEADAKQPGKHRFYLRTTQHLGGTARLSFPVAPGYSGEAVVDGMPLEIQLLFDQAWRQASTREREIITGTLRVIAAGAS